MSATTSTPDLPNWLALQKAKNAADGIGGDNLLTPPPAAAPSWWNNPVGSEQLNDTYAGMPSSDVSPVIGAYGARPVTAAMRGNALDIASAASQFGPADVASIRAFHGSPYDFNAFDTSKIGTGEGAQAYGHGLYFAGSENTARYYRDTLSKWTDNVAQHVNDITGIDLSEDYLPAIRQIAMGQNPGAGSATTALKARVPELREVDGHSMIGPHPTLERLIEAIRGDQNKGSMYEVSLNADPEHFLDWDQTIGTHPDPVRDTLYDMGYGATQRGKDVYMHMSRGPGGDEAASAKLKDAGIPGIKYLDQGSRAEGKGTSNFVIFDPKTIEILRKYGIAGLMAGGTAAATQPANSDQ